MNAAVVSIDSPHPGKGSTGSKAVAKQTDSRSPSEIRSVSRGRKVPVYDHADCVIEWADAGRVAQLLQDNRNTVLGTKRRIRGIRLTGPDPGLSLAGGSGPRTVVGMPHRKENYYNVQGVWHIDRIPESARDLFLLSITDNLKAA